MDFYKVEIKSSAEREIFSLNKKAVFRIWQNDNKIIFTRSQIEIDRHPKLARLYY